MATKPKAESDQGARSGTNELRLPPWAQQQENGTFLIDPDIAYPMILQSLGIPEAEYDQYWIEVAYQIAKMKMMDLFEYADPPPPSRNLFIDASGDRKERWRLANHPEGRGIEAATKGKEARVHYQRVRDRIG